MTLLDGKKYSFKSAQTIDAGRDLASYLNIDVKKLGMMSIAIGNMGGRPVFSGALMLWGATPPSLGTIAILIVGSIVLAAILTVWWPQAVLFTQKLGIRLKNTLFFILFHPGRVLGGAVLQVVYWLILFLFLPWTAFVVPILGDWYIIFLAVFFIYRPMNKDFKIEEQIREAFPDNLPEEEYIP